MALRTRLSTFALTLGLGLGLGAVAGCGTQTSVTQLWSAPASPSTPPMRTIVVMAVDLDEANRRSLEDALVRELAEHGVDGVTSYVLFQDGPPDREKAQATVERVGADGILTAKLRGIRERLGYVPGTYPGGWWGGYYGYGWPYAYQYGYGAYDGYGYADELVNIETTLWDARAADTVVWSALTETENPSNGSAFVESVSEKVVPAIAAARFIPPKRKD